MKKISLVLMTLCFALSANAFAAGKHHHKHMAKAGKATPTAAAPAATPAAK